MITGQWSIAALRGIRHLKRRLALSVFKQAAMAEGFADPAVQEKMLLDGARCEAYREALARTVRPGDVVVDLGAGTGLLSFFAAQSGARRVYAIEMGRIADLAARLIEANDLRDRITLIRANSRKVRLPERCDLLVTETLGVCGFDNENVIDYIADARRRMLKPEARIIPESFDTLFMPIQSEEFGVGRLPARLYDLDYTPFRRERYKKPLILEASGKQMVELAEPARRWPIDLRRESRTPGPTTFDLQILREGRLDGFLGWFEATMCPGLSLSNSPRLPLTNWSQLYFPILDQPRVSPGQHLRLEVSPRMVAGEAQWEYRINLTSFPPCARRAAVEP
jgi:protein arginine N-methyltransferase 1